MIMTSTAEKKTVSYANLAAFPVRGLGPGGSSETPLGTVYAMMAVWQDASGDIPEGENAWRIGEVWGPGSEGQYTPMNAGEPFDQNSFHRPYELLIGATTSTTTQIAFREFVNVPPQALEHLTPNQQAFIGSGAPGSTPGTVPDPIRSIMMGE